MNPSSALGSSVPAVWTCPFCPLLCDHLALARGEHGRPQLVGSECAVAAAGLAECGDGQAQPRVDGQPVTLDQAIAQAGARLSTSRQPLLGGLGTDVAGARALYRLARATGAMADAASGRALTQALRAQQDRGGFTTTLAEVHERADVIVFVGSWAPERLPELLPRVLAGRAGHLPELIALGTEAPGEAWGCTVSPLAAPHGLFDTVAALKALVALKTVHEHNEALVHLARTLRHARYAVLVWEPAQLGPHAGLLIERIQQLIGLLNVQGHGRAAGFPLGGGDGAATVNQVFTWLSGLPLRSRVGPLGPEHEPLRFDAQDLLSRGEVDALLWVSSFRAAPVPVLAQGPRIVLGLPALAAQLGDEAQTVFIPVATPGLHASGHLCRADGVVMLPLHAPLASDLPSLSEVVTRIQQSLQQEEAE
jgi:formylmethanofuran dehydrogenase subunit B